MRIVRLAYRDNDRTPVIYCIKAMAEQYYDFAVQVLQIEGREAFEAALFEKTCDVIIEHIEYLYAEAVRGKSIAVRDLGRPSPSPCGCEKWAWRRTSRRSSSRTKKSAAGSSGKKL